MSFGLWNKIKKGLAKAKAKVGTAIKKGAAFVRDNPELISSAAGFIAGGGPKFNVNYASDEDDDYETAGMIQPRYK